MSEPTTESGDTQRGPWGCVVEDGKCLRGSHDHVYVNSEQAAVLRVPPACDSCSDTGLVPWMSEADPNCYQEPDGDGTIACPDCQVRSSPGRDTPC